MKLEGVVVASATALLLSGCGGGDEPHSQTTSIATTSSASTSTTGTTTTIQTADVIPCQTQPDKMFPNIGWILGGYNIYQGNPMPGGKADPGFMQRPLFVADFSGCLTTPDQRHVRPAAVDMEEARACEASFSSKSFSSMAEYSSSLTSSMSVKVSAEVPSGGGSFGYSSTSSSARQNIQEKKWKMISSSAQCSAYSATLTPGHLPATTKTFQDAADGVSDAKSFHELFDTFGTHFMTTVTMGSKFGYHRFSEECAYFNAAKKTKQWDWGVAANLEANATLAASAGQSGGTTDEQKEFHQAFSKEETVMSLGASLKFNQDQASWSDESADSPMPIQYDMTYICDHPALQSKKGDCLSALKGYCEYLNTQPQHRDAKVNCNGKQPAVKCQWDSDCNKGSDRTYTCKNAGTADAVCQEAPKKMVTMDQPHPYKGGYTCRKLTMSIDDLMLRDNGCNTFNHLQCDDGRLPFKWGAYCYGGSITVPEGVCVNLISLTGSWGSRPCDNPQKKLGPICAEPGKGPLTKDFTHEQNVCAFEFITYDARCESPPTVALSNSSYQIIV